MKYFSVVYSAILAPYAVSSGDFGVVYLESIGADLTSAFELPEPELAEVELSRAGSCANALPATANSNAEASKSFELVGNIASPSMKVYIRRSRDVRHALEPLAKVISSLRRREMFIAEGQYHIALRRSAM